MLEPLSYYAGTTGALWDVTIERKGLLGPWRVHVECCLVDAARGTSFLRDKDLDHLADCATLDEAREVARKFLEGGQ